MSKYLIVIGLTRSGTTFITNLLGRSNQFRVEVEPHALWKSGNYKYFNDEEYKINESITFKIRKELTKNLGDKRLLEKSPINSIRPDLVHATFPDAKIIYIERDPIRCIYSNYVRSIKNDSFKPSITLRKYLYKTGTDDLPFATSNRKIFSQLKITDYLYFVRYVLYMIWIRTSNPSLFPFGPKLKDFKRKISTDGILAYHVEVFRKSTELKKTYKKLYGERMESFKMEELMSNEKELKKLYDWAEIEFTNSELSEVLSGVDEERKEKSVQASKIDEDIRKLLAK